MEKYNLADNNFTKKQIGRRSFLKKVTALLGGITFYELELVPQQRYMGRYPWREYRQ